MAIARIKKNLDTLGDNRRYNSRYTKWHNPATRAGLSRMDDFMDECLPQDTERIRNGCYPQTARARLIEPIGTSSWR